MPGSPASYVMAREELMWMIPSWEILLKKAAGNFVEGAMISIRQDQQMWYSRWISIHIIQRKQIALNVIIHMHYGREWNEIIAQKIHESFCWPQQVPWSCPRLQDHLMCF